ncbi:anthranilate synthase component I [Desulfofalx alkaliphila]|uniref:anthranilate synthase component I n=1 Tax=Desulfofalx alkaliphila TaxID=105483 RepID=UPI00068A6145|nr:anthranilate synthase component I [Desulfofalx alkaliphila]
MLTEQQYIDLSSEYNLIPVYRQWLADTETPVTVYQKLKPLNPVYLLESVDGGQQVTRYSFIGLKPFATFSSKGTDVVFSSDGEVKKLSGKPLDLLYGVLCRYHCPKLPGLPRFYGGAVGYIGYDAVTTLEKLPQTTLDDLNLPDTFFVLCSVVLIFDHLKHTITGVVNSRVITDASAGYRDAQNTLDEIQQLMQQHAPLELPLNTTAGPVKSNCTREEFIAQVKKAKEYIAAGDVFQVVLSKRFSCHYSGDPFQVYRRLRSLNPSPYMYYLNFGAASIVGASPEMLVRVEGGLVQTQPIAGTRPRGVDEDHDNRLAADLLADRKEQAEHIMLVDLGRTDLGRVCQPGSVRVDSYMQVEKYSHVMHLVSSVKGVLKDEFTPIDAFKACFPAGTVSGAPKIPAMEIIDELESTRRGIYSGAIGYLGFNRSLDTAIAIRTIVFHNKNAYFQAGAGIVADSDPESEYLETINKAAVLAKALGIEKLKLTKAGAQSRVLA